MKKEYNPENSNLAFHADMFFLVVCGWGLYGIFTTFFHITTYHGTFFLTLFLEEALL